MEVKEAQTHFKIRDPVLGGTLSCLVVLDFSCMQIYLVLLLFLFFEEGRNRVCVLLLILCAKHAKAAIALSVLAVAEE